MAQRRPSGYPVARTRITTVATSTAAESGGAVSSAMRSLPSTLLDSEGAVRSLFALWYTN